jgi:hypothetical protein
MDGGVVGWLDGRTDGMDRWMDGGAGGGVGE